MSLGVVPSSCGAPHRRPISKGSWYWKPLRNLTPGNRVFAYVGGAGYVGVGEVTGEMMPARDAKVDVDGRLTPFLELTDVDASIRERATNDDPGVTEMVVPIAW